jgi:hypothetical protein
VIGVEFDPRFDATARRSIDVFRDQQPLTEFEQVSGDAKGFEFPPTPTVSILDKFDELFTGKALANAESTHTAASSDLCCSI